MSKKLVKMMSNKLDSLYLAFESFNAEVNPENKSCMLDELSSSIDEFENTFKMIKKGNLSDETIRSLRDLYKYFKRDFKE